MIRIRFRRSVRRLDPGTFLGVWTSFWPHLGESRRMLGLALASTLAYTALTVLRPWPLKFVLDYAFGPPDAPRPGFLAGVPAARIVAGCAAAILLIAVLAALAAYGQRYLGARTGQVLAHRLRRDLYLHVQHMSLADHARARTGELVMRLTSDMSLLRNLLVPTTLKILAQWLLVLGACAQLIWLDATLAVLALAVVPPLALSASYSGRRIREAVREQRRREGELAAASAEALGSIALVKLHGAESHEADRLQGSQASSFRTGLRATRLQAAFERQVELLVAVGTCLVLAVGARRVLNGTLSAGDLVLAIAYVSMLSKPLRSFSRLTGRLAKGVVASERVIRILESPIEDLHRPGAIVPARVDGHFRLDDVWFRYGDAPWALRGVSLVIRPGERIALVGRSGSGKSTLARLLPRLYAPAKGTIELDGVPLEEIELAALRESIAFVLQETVLLGVSIRDNITYGAAGLPEEAIVEAARLARIHERIRRLPDGYDTVLGERGAGLSGGERQRIALARALARRAPIVVLDEPDTHLDPRARAELWDVFDEVTRGRTSICIVHDIGNAARADRIVVLEEGRVAGTGSHDELVAGCAAYRELLALESEPGRTVDAAS